MADKGGFLSLFEDPVAGPQIGIGLLSTGLGLLTSPPNQANNAIQGGLGQISQGLYYGGRQKAKKTAKEEELARRLAFVEEFKRLHGGQGAAGPQGALVAPPASLPGPSYTPGTGTMPPWAPGPPAPPPGPQPAPGPQATGQAGDISQEDAMMLAAQYPEMQKILTPFIKPRERTKTQELLDLLHGNDEVGKRFALRSFGEEPTLELSALEQYHKGQADRAERQLALSAAGQSQANADRDARFAWEKSRGGGADKLSAFQQKMSDLGYAPGSPEYEKSGRIAAGLEPRASNATPIYNEKGEVTGYIGGGPKPLTEQQGKNVVNATGGQQAQDALEQVRASGFDPTSLSGATEVALAEVPVIGGMVSKEAQMQAAANRQVSAALNYARSGSNITELEMENTKQSLLDKQGDKPENTQYKTLARQALIDAMQASDPVRIGNLVRQYAKGPSDKDTKSQSPTQKLSGGSAPAREDIEAELRRRGLLK